MNHNIMDICQVIKIGLFALWFDLSSLLASANPTARIVDHAVD
jgi:hypothetical protein